ncbi:unnamed protein product, partial [Prorocentrum cordatum]
TDGTSRTTTGATSARGPWCRSQTVRSGRLGSGLLGRRSSRTRRSMFSLLGLPSPTRRRRRRQRQPPRAQAKVAARRALRRHRGGRPRRKPPPPRAMSTGARGYTTRAGTRTVAHQLHPSQPIRWRPCGPSWATTAPRRWQQWRSWRVRPGCRKRAMLKTLRPRLLSGPSARGRRPVRSSSRSQWRPHPLLQGHRRSTCPRSWARTARSRGSPSSAAQCSARKASTSTLRTFASGGELRPTLRLASRPRSPRRSALLQSSSLLFERRPSRRPCGRKRSA